MQLSGFEGISEHAVRSAGAMRTRTRCHIASDVDSDVNGTIGYSSICEEDRKENRLLSTMVVLIQVISSIFKYI